MGSHMNTKFRHKGASCLCPCSPPPGFRRTGLSMKNCDMTYFHAPIRVLQHLKHNAMTDGLLALSILCEPTSTPTQSWSSRLSDFLESKKITIKNVFLNFKPPLFDFWEQCNKQQTQQWHTYKFDMEETQRGINIHLESYLCPPDKSKPNIYPLFNSSLHQFLREKSDSLAAKCSTMFTS